MALIQCKECNKDISNTAKICPSCGAPVEKKPKQVSKLTIALVSSIGVLFVYSAINGSTEANKPNVSPHETTTTSNTTSQPTTTTASQLSEYAFKLDEAQKRMVSNTDALKKYYATAHQVKQATEDSLLLASIRMAYSGEHRTQEELALKTKAEKLAPKVIEQGRELYASMLQETFVKKGMDIDIEAKGKSNKTLRIKYVLMSQPLIYKFQNDMKLDEQAKQYGFTKIIYTNGFDGELGNTWSLDL